MKVWVDDVRKPPDNKWLWCKFYEEAVYIINNEDIQLISLDHDLGEEKNGYDLACIIEGRVYNDPDYTPPIIEVHSQNPVGVQNIKMVVKHIEKVKKNNGKFF